MTPSTEIRYITPDGRATFDFMAFLLELIAYCEAIDARVDDLDGGGP